MEWTSKMTKTCSSIWLCEYCKLVGPNLESARMLTTLIVFNPCCQRQLWAGWTKVKTSRSTSLRWSALPQEADRWWGLPCSAPSSIQRPGVWNKETYMLTHVTQRHVIVNASDACFKFTITISHYRPNLMLHRHTNASTMNDVLHKNTFKQNILHHL